MPIGFSGKRCPVFFLGCAHRKDTHPRFEKLSKADWADAFCDLYRQIYGEGSTSEAMLDDAERRIRLLKQQGMR